MKKRQATIIDNRPYEKSYTVKFYEKEKFAYEKKVYSLTQATKLKRDFV